METSSFLRDLVILFGIAVLTSYGFRVLRLSTIAGFLVAGALVGPFGLRLISSVEAVERMSELGVMLLLFSIGGEFSAEKLLKMRWLAIAGGSLQMLITASVAAAIIHYWMPSLRPAIFGGLLAGLSSTVIALRLLYDRGQSFSPQGSAALAILIFQDIAVVPVMLFLPFLTGKRPFDLQSIVMTTAVSAVAVVLLLLASWFVAPRVI